MKKKKKLTYLYYCFPTWFTYIQYTRIRASSISASEHSILIHTIDVFFYTNQMKKITNKTVEVCSHTFKNCIKWIFFTQSYNFYGHWSHQIAAHRWKKSKFSYILLGWIDKRMCVHSCLWMNVFKIKIRSFR